MPRREDTHHPRLTAAILALAVVLPIWAIVDVIRELR